MAPRLWHRRCPAELPVTAHPMGTFMGLWVQSETASVSTDLIDGSALRGEPMPDT
jgi:hypothetical protein